MSKNILLLIVFFVTFSAFSKEQMESTPELIIKQDEPCLTEEMVEQAAITDEEAQAILLAEQAALKAKQHRLLVQVNFCAPCHGKSGVSVIDIYPDLAGQQSDYLLKQLRDFKSKARKDAVMNGLVSRLTDEDMQGLAQYYADIVNEYQQPALEIKNEKINSTGL